MAKYALVIGISHYSGLSPLPTPTNDAEEVAKILEDHGKFNVTRCPYKRNEVSDRQEMVNRTVNKSEVIAKIRQFLSDAKKNEALIYFIGHGIEDSTDLGNPKGLLAASDFKVKRDDNNTKVVGYENGISFQALNEEFKNADLSNLVVILDCCHSGHLIQDGYFIERKLLESRFDAFSASKDYFLIASCRSSQESIIVQGKPRGVFTDALVKALSQENAGTDGNITCNLLLDNINRELRENNENQEVVHYGGGKSIQLLTYPLKHPENKISQEVTLNRDNPYLGLDSFKEEQTDLFYGRSKAVGELIDILNSSRFVAVIGASGCGKSSLVRAGLLPEFKTYLTERSSWQQEIVIPGDQPIDNLRRVLRDHTDNQPWLLFIDQFEEIFTLTHDEEQRKRFINLVAKEATNPDKQTYVIIAVRGDFLDRCANYPEAGKLINQKPKTYYVVQPLSPPELEEAIAKPANKHGVKFEPGLVSQISSDVNLQPGALPLLQYALKRLWKVCIEDESNENPQLTFNGYEQIGGVKGALNIEATQIYNDLTSENDKNFVQELFTMELVQLGGEDGQEATRKRVMKEGLNELRASEWKRAIINRFAKARLIVSDDKKIEVAHEALFTEWSLLKQWIEEHRDDIRLRQKLKSRYREWKEDYNESPDQLLTGKLLSDIKERKEKIGNLSPEEEDFIQKSLERREQEEQKELEVAKRELEQEREINKAEEGKQKQLRLGLWILSTLLTACIASLAWSAETQKNFIRYSVEKTEQLSKNNQQLEALTESINVLEFINQSLITNRKDFLDRLRVVLSNVKEQNRLEGDKGHKETILDAKISQDGQIIVSGGADKTIKVWSIEKGFLATTQPQSGWISTIDLNHNSNELLAVSTSLDGYIQVWQIDVQNEEVNIREKYKFHQQMPGILSNASFNSDNTLIAFASPDGYIRIWDTTKVGSESEKNKILTLGPAELDTTQSSGSPKYNRSVFNLNFHPKSNIIAYGDKDRKVYIWNIDLEPKPLEIKHKLNIITAIRFSPDGKYLASASNDGNIKIWDITSNYQLKGEINSENSIYGLAFTNNGDFIASSHSDKDKGIAIWNVAEIKKDKILEKPYVRLVGHTKGVKGISFSPNDQYIISSSQDATIRVWRWKDNEIDTANNTAKELLKSACNFSRFYLLTHTESKTIKDTNNICQKYQQ